MEYSLCSICYTSDTWPRSSTSFFVPRCRGFVTLVCIEVLVLFVVEYMIDYWHLTTLNASFFFFWKVSSACSNALGVRVCNTSDWPCSMSLFSFFWKVSSVRYNAREYVTHMTALNDELARAWNNEERVKVDTSQKSALQSFNTVYLVESWLFRNVCCWQWTTHQGRSFSKVSCIVIWYSMFSSELTFEKFLLLKMKNGQGSNSQKSAL